MDVKNLILSRRYRQGRVWWWSKLCTSTTRVQPPHPETGRSRYGGAGPWGCCWRSSTFFSHPLLQTWLGGQFAIAEPLRSLLWAADVFGEPSEPLRHRPAAVFFLRWTVAYTYPYVYPARGVSAHGGLYVCFAAPYSPNRPLMAE